MINTLRPPLVLVLSRKTINNICRTISSTSKRPSFHELDEKSGYPTKSDYQDEAKTVLQKMRQGWKFLIEEFKLFKEEMKEAVLLDPTIVARPGEVDVQWKFDGDPDILQKWVVTADSDYGEGNSTASLELTKTGRGIFTGHLDPQVFRDGKLKRTGYCNLQSVKLRRSFQRHVFLEWGPYTHFIMRVRGDGRNYLLILSTPGEFDILWNDSYQYVLNTRGGPYWQYVRIPFSKFFLVSHGRVQDTQQPVPAYRIATIGITMADKIAGNFKLEIDYIGVEYDPIHEEEHAYEMYRTPHKFHV